MVEIFIILSD